MWHRCSQRRLRLLPEPPASSRVAPDEWLTFEEAAVYLKKTPKAFEKVVDQGEIPKHYITERGILFSRKELDEWLLER